MTIKELKTALTEKNITFSNSANKATLEALLVEVTIDEPKPVVMSKAQLKTALKTEGKFQDAISKASGALTEHYRVTLEAHGLIKANGLPTTSGKVLTLVFHDYPLSENNKPVGIEVAKLEHDGAAFVKRAYMAIRKADETAKFNALSPEAQQEAKDQKSGKGKGKGQGGKPEVLKASMVLEYLSRNPKVAFEFVLAAIAKTSETAEHTMLCADTSEAIENYMAIG